MPKNGPYVLHYSVGIATNCGVDGPGFGQGARFSGPIQTGLPARLASCAVDTVSVSQMYSGRSVTLTTDVLPHNLAFTMVLEVVDREALGSRFA